MSENLTHIIDQHLSHRNEADRNCREQLIASIREWAKEDKRGR
jgi:hypothetical protein